MARKDVDVLISGGGIAGLVCAAALSRLNLSVTLVDPTPPPKTGADQGSDLRSTAFLMPARQLFEDIGVWDALEPDACALEVLRVIDCSGEPPAPVADRAFRSEDLGEPAFGWNLPNWLTRKCLTEALNDMPNVDLRVGTGFASMLTRESEALVTLSDGSRHRARLVIGADGRNSPVREAAGIDVRTKHYGQKAFAFVVTHTEPHDHVSTELYLSGGAFTLVPLPDQDGRHMSAVVWMNDGETARQLDALDDTNFAQAATTRSCGVLGDLALASKRATWPIITQEAFHLTAPRTALIAEAAHVFPPIGAQGLNTSLHDVSALATLAEKAPGTIGEKSFLDAFAAARHREVRARAGIIDLYNRVCRSDAPIIQALRSLGLRLTHDVAPLRRSVMRAGLGG